MADGAARRQHRTLGYLAVWILYSERDDNVGLPDIVYMHVGFLAWLAVASAALSFVLARRSRAGVRTLMEVRRQLVSESTRAGRPAQCRTGRTPSRRAVAGPAGGTLGTSTRSANASRTRAWTGVHAALQETAVGLRSTVTALHPQVLAQLGPQPRHTRSCCASTRLGRTSPCGRTWRTSGTPKLGPCCTAHARELLANINKHAGASTVSVGLFRIRDRVSADRGRRRQGVRPVDGGPVRGRGHIGLASLQVRVEAMGGSMAISSEPGYGTQVLVTL